MSEMPEHATVLTIPDPPKRRGRPRKHPLPEAAVTTPVPVPSTPEQPVKRGPGRPRKASIAQTPAVPVAEPVAPVAKKKRGRPAKKAAAEVARPEAAITVDVPEIQPTPLATDLPEMAQQPAVPQDVIDQAREQANGKAEPESPLSADIEKGIRWLTAMATEVLSRGEESLRSRLAALEARIGAMDTRRYASREDQQDHADAEAMHLEN